jgi:uncharacterized protein (TIGR03083 family)
MDRLFTVQVKPETFSPVPAPVPSCPGWSVANLTGHVGHVYLHKALTMQEGAEPDPWPRPETVGEEPVALLDRAYAALLAEFAARRPEEHSATWYGPDQTVGFWIRRMAQETVIHRIDAELAVGLAVAAVPDDLAVDGIDELLKVFIGYYVAEWPDAFAEVLGGSPGRTFAVRTDGAGWRVRTGPGLFTVDDGAGDDADVTVSGPPAAVLRWLWGRERSGEPRPVAVEGRRRRSRSCGAASRPRPSERRRPDEPGSGVAGGVHDDGHADQAQGGPGQVVAVRAELVDDHAPGERPRHEHPAVRGEDAAEVRVGLERGDEAVQAEGDDAGGDPQHAAVLPPALPDEPRTADLGDRGQQEQQDGADDRHDPDGTEADRSPDHQRRSGLRTQMSSGSAEVGEEAFPCGTGESQNRSVRVRRIPHVGRGPVLGHLHTRIGAASLRSSPVGVPSAGVLP